MPVLTAPFAMMAHFAPYHYYRGFSRWWYEHHLSRRGFRIETLSPNGNLFAFCQQELMRLGSMVRRNADWIWPVAYGVGVLGALFYIGYEFGLA